MKTRTAIFLPLVFPFFAVNSKDAFAKEWLQYEQHQAIFIVILK